MKGRCRPEADVGRLLANACDGQDWSSKRSFITGVFTLIAGDYGLSGHEICRLDLTTLTLKLRLLRKTAP
jgi:hypothetical protein